MVEISSKMEEIDGKKLEVINTYIDKQQEYLNDIIKKNLILESQNTYLNERVKELEKLNKVIQDRLNYLDGKFAEKTKTNNNFKNMFGGLFGGKSDNDGEVNNMNPVENINDEVYPQSIEKDKPNDSPSGKLVIRGGRGLPPMPKKS
jgi:ribosomal protein L16 Arg81 hydroxylase